MVLMFSWVPKHRSSDPFCCCSLLSIWRFGCREWRRRLQCCAESSWECTRQIIGWVCTRRIIGRVYTKHIISRICTRQIIGRVCTIHIICITMLPFRPIVVCIYCPPRYNWNIANCCVKQHTITHSGSSLDPWKITYVITWIQLCAVNHKMCIFGIVYTIQITVQCQGKHQWEV